MDIGAWVKIVQSWKAVDILELVIIIILAAKM